MISGRIYADSQGLWNAGHNDNILIFDMMYLN